ncbi:hypothetical protein J3E64_002695 [Sphingobium sp. OAS761]|nr:hypothetical protein [Sphingobium sp. OAS761]
MSRIVGSGSWVVTEEDNFWVVIFWVIVALLLLKACSS